MMHSAVVVIPVYKPELSEYERIALIQCQAVLSKYNIVFAKPKSLEIDFKIADVQFSTLSFDDHYFEDIHGYNRLMLSADFYESFGEYEYMLIYQLDAFVFTDQLDYWCSQAYDYIGAPWFAVKDPSNIFDQLINQIKNYFYVRYNVKHKDGMPKIGKQLAGRVGNGGFSLRKTEVFIKYCIQYKSLIEHYCSLRHAWFNEDIFWSIELNRKKQQLRIPKLKKALKFAFETRPEKALEINKGQLPFGCHAWDKNIDFWRPFFKVYGYEV
ncbi:hypothetical protein SAMN05428975_3920 [Mucilaginibacter sp. OK268]|uniref:DUF5672 family protein n=1 Tax=Mucilaginibacter sp. OK268 TaxID=1881048 RepID=UPI000882275D|nr:DUF5672 family protein [Mucilaginibacter sp. OK268]SDP94404.1 hypothetical protein SAMN05428975_3920 [Mucilaginibacter sp. OK268]